jgi:V/A-type H+-transporting ATPase subunit E
MADLPKVPSGVQELIGRLRDEGVKAGKQEAESVLQEARQQADQIVAQANAEADEIRVKARTEIEAERAASREAIQMAFRDTTLKLKSQVMAAFSDHVTRLVSMELRDKDFLRQAILAIFGQATQEVAKDQPVEVLVSEELFVTDEKGSRLTEEGKERLRHMVLGISGEMLREGVDLKPSGETNGGMRVRLVGEDLEIDLSDEALSELLLGYLIPRFRAIVTGVE